MSTDEFSAGADQWQALLDLDPTQAIAAACRGSGDPATLAWIAEALELDATSTIVDIGSGLGGAAAWLATRYQCRVVATDPVFEATRCARHVFGLPAAVASGSHLPLADHSMDAAIALGVLSVVDDPTALLHEARRVAPRLAVLAYLSTSTSAVRCGGSTFRSQEELLSVLDGAGWTVLAGPTPTTIAAPPSWDIGEANAEDDPDESAVAGALDAGRIEPCTVVAAGSDPHHRRAPR
ncbi:MAG: class I SAM-dependent methyltransferase [Acidimicrobiales bacterium]